MDPETPETPTIGPRLLRRALLVSFALYVTLGLPDGVLGTVWPSLRDSFGRSDGSFGLLIVCSAVGYTLASVGSGHLTQHFSTGLVLRNSTFTAVVGLGVVSLAPSWWISMIGFAVLGAGWGLSDAVVNAWMALTQGVREMGLLHAAYGVGAFLGPFLAAPFVADGNLWRGPFVVVGGLGIVLVAGIASVRRGFDSAPVSFEVAGSPAPVRGSAMLLALLIVWFSIYVGIEVTVGQWSYTLLTESRDYPGITAAALVAGFWGGVMLGRLLLAGFGNRVPPERVLAAAIGGAVLGIMFFWVDPVGVGACALPFIGLSLAAMFPLVIGRTAVYLGGAQAARVVGYQIAASSVGFVILPASVGVLADYHGVDAALPVAFVASCVLAVLWAVIQAQVARSAAPRPV